MTAEHCRRRPSLSSPGGGPASLWDRDDGAGLLAPASDGSASVPGEGTGDGNERWGADATAGVGANVNDTAIGGSASAVFNAATAVGHGADISAGSESTAVGEGASASSGASGEATAAGQDAAVGASRVGIGKEVAVSGSLAGSGVDDGYCVFGDAGPATREFVIGDSAESAVRSAQATTSPVSGTDQDGDTLLVRGGTGTGTGTPGPVVFAIASPGGSGSSLNSPTDRLTVDHQAVRIHTSGRIAIDPGSFIGGTIPLTSDGDDLNVVGAGISRRTSVMRIEASVAGLAITGMHAGSQLPRLVRLVNTGDHAIRLAHQDSASSANWRLTLPGGHDMVLGPDGSASWWYDPVSGTWRLLATAPYSVTLLAASLYGYWRADAGVTARVPVAQLVAADSEYFSHADHATLSLSGDWTIVAPVWLDSTASLLGIVSKHISAGDEREYNIVFDHTLNRFRATVSSDGTSGATTTVVANDLGAVSTDTLYWLVLQHEDGVGLTLRVNLATSDTAAHAGGVYAGTAIFQVGAVVAAGANPFDGRIGPVGIAGSILSDEVLEELYDGGNLRYWSQLDSGTQALFAHWWDMTELSGTRAASTGGMDLTENTGGAAITAAQGPRDAVAAGLTGLVSQIDDMSANGRNMVETDPGLMPVYGVDADGPYILFDSSRSTRLQATSVTPPGDWPVQLGAVFDTGGSASAEGIVLAAVDDDNTDRYVAIGHDASGNALLTADDTSGATDLTTAAIDDGDPHLVVAECDGDTARAIYLDGDTASASDTTSINWPSGIDTVSLGVCAASTPFSYADDVKLREAWISTN